MKTLKYLLLAVVYIVISGCNSAESTSVKSLKYEQVNCPKCHMELKKSTIHTASIKIDGDISYFDDIGCMVLWSSENNIELNGANAKVFSNDTKKYIDSFSAFYKIGEITPMSYGFCAYEKEVDNSIDFKEVTLKMLRGEHMANPKIRKQILGMNDAQ